MSVESYFIKSGYEPNTVALTDDGVSGETYWNKARLHASTYYQYAVYMYAARKIREFSAKRVVDVGCGPGTKLSTLHSRFPEVDFTGVDLPNAIEYCSRAYNWGSWMTVNIESPAGSGKEKPFDLAICSDVIEHLIDPDMLLAYLRSILRSRGVAILSTPERDRLRGRECFNCPHPHHVREWNFQEFEAYLRDRGCAILDHTLSYPMRFGPNRETVLQFLRSILTVQSLKWNQICLVQFD